MAMNGAAPFRVLIADDPHPIAAKIFEENDICVDQVKKLTPDHLAHLDAYDALIVRGSEVKDEAIFKNAKRLRVIGRAGTGYDNINRELAARNKIVVMNAPDGNAPAAAELTMAHILNLARPITLANAKMHAGTWTRAPHKDDFQLRGKTLGIIGFGRIGSRVANYARSFGMEIVAYDPYIPDEKVEGFGATRVRNLRNLLQTADIVTLHADLNEETRHIVNAETLNLCKKGVYIVNCARGPMIDAAALAKAIADGHVANAALDVLDNEPTKGDPDKWQENPLLKFEQIVFTPHLGGTTKESLEDVARQAAEEVIAYLKEGIVMNAVVNA